MNLDAAKKAHAEFRRTMRAAGLRVLTVRDILSFGVEDHMGARVELEELAMQALQYEIAEGNSMEEIAAGVYRSVHHDHLSPSKSFASYKMCSRLHGLDWS